MNLETIKEELEKVIRTQDKAFDAHRYMDLRTRVVALASLAQIACFKEDQKVMKQRWEELQKQWEELRPDKEEK